MHRKMRVQATSMAWSASSGMFKNNAGDDTNLLSLGCLGGGGGGGQCLNMMTMGFSHSSTLMLPT